MHIAYLCVTFTFLVVTAQYSQSSGEFSARELDSLLQDHAFKSLIRPRTGIVYDGKLPTNFTGIGVTALRLRSGSLRRRGVSGFKEFRVPVGVIEQPYCERLVLVYHNLGNWSSSYYPIPGYTYLAPVLGLLAYDATDLSASSLSELDIRASESPISIEFPDVNYRANGSSPMCVNFGLDGSVGFDNLVRENTCLTTNQGHFSIVVESLVAPAPSPTSEGVVGGGEKGGIRKTVWIIIGCVVGAMLILIFLGMLFGHFKRCRSRRRIRRMEEEAEEGVALPMKNVGYAKAPAALETRTRPFLENEFVP
ncbi:uncharacterized protein [Henckelia pumila]|uniref:uncharacterized protein n=1 Tax=Henckelia pumila TaxID=405737 RepID=UPI003C6DF885